MRFNGSLNFMVNLGIENHKRVNQRLSRVWVFGLCFIGDSLSDPSMDGCHFITVKSIDTLSCDDVVRLIYHLKGNWADEFVFGSYSEFIKVLLAIVRDARHKKIDSMQFHGLASMVNEQGQ